MASFIGINEDSGIFLVERSHLFKTLGEEDGLKLLSSGEVVHYWPGDLILREGEPGQTFYLLKHGHVEVSTIRDGERISLAKLSKGAFFGEVSLLTKKARTADVIALDEVEAIQFENSVIEQMMKDYPKVRELLQAVVIGRARKTIEKLSRE